MSLRKSSGEDHELPPKNENPLAEAKRAHRLLQCGPFWSCCCGQVFSHAATRRDGEIQISIHQKAVVELIEDNRQGVSHYGDDEE